MVRQIADLELALRRGSCPKLSDQRYRDRGCYGSVTLSVF